MAPPATATSLPSPAPPAPKKLEEPSQREVLPEQDVGEVISGEFEEPSEGSTLRTDWAAARAAMERAVGDLRERAEEIAKETMERHHEQRAIEEETRVLHERKMTIYEDAEPGPLDELRFPPGLERGGSESEVSTTFTFHSSEPTTETLVEEPDQEIEAPAEGLPEKLIENLETQEFPEVDSISREEPDTVKELAIVPEEPAVGPEPSHVQVSTEELKEEVANPDEIQASQEAAPILHEAPVVAEEHPLEQGFHVPSDPLSSVIEEASDTQSEHLSSSLEFPRPPTPYPALDDSRVASPVPFPVTSDHEDQGYGTQDDEDRTTQTPQRSPGKHVHWGGVEAKPAYPPPQDEDDKVEGHSPPFSRLLLPAPAPAETQRDERPERATRITTRRTMPPALQKPMRKFEQGVYTVTDVRWGMALDLSGADNRSPIAFGSHGWENQQVSVDVFDSQAADPGADSHCSHASYSGSSVPAAPDLLSRMLVAAHSSLSRTCKDFI